jgi:hypothetical protein
MAAGPSSTHGLTGLTSVSQSLYAPLFCDPPWAICFGSSIALMSIKAVFRPAPRVCCVEPRAITHEPSTYKDVLFCITRIKKAAAPGAIISTSTCSRRGPVSGRSNKSSRPCPDRHSLLARAKDRISCQTVNLKLFTGLLGSLAKAHSPLKAQRSVSESAEFRSPGALKTGSDERLCCECSDRFE